MHFAIGDTRCFADLYSLNKNRRFKGRQNLQTYYLVGFGLFSVAGVRARARVV